MRTRLICGVSRGDLPLRLTWLKDGEFLMPSLGANVSSIDQFTSILSIPSLSHTHSGEYTCVASNQASEVKYSATLQVKGNVDETKKNNPWHLQIFHKIVQKKKDCPPNTKKKTKSCFSIAFDATNPSLTFLQSCKFSFLLHLISHNARINVNIFEISLSIYA